MNDGRKEGRDGGMEEGRRHCTPPQRQPQHLVSQEPRDTSIFFDAGG